MTLFETLLDINNESKYDKYLLAIAMYVNFHYERIVSEEYMLDYLVASENQLNKFHDLYPEYTRRQIESIYIAFTFIIVLVFHSYNE
jgi:hypothetical protein